MLQHAPNHLLLMTPLEPKMCEIWNQSRANPKPREQITNRLIYEPELLLRLYLRVSTVSYAITYPEKLVLSTKKMP